MATCPPAILLSPPDCARLLGISARQCRRLATQGVLPRQGRQFDPFVVVPAFLAYVRRGSDASSDLAEARLRLTEAQRREIESRTRRGERLVLAADLVAGAFEAAMTLVGSQLDALGRRLAPELSQLIDPVLVQEKLFHECRRIRNAAADQLEAMASDPARREGAAGTDAEDA